MHALLRKCRSALRMLRGGKWPDFRDACKEQLADVGRATACGVYKVTGGLLAKNSRLATAQKTQLHAAAEATPGMTAPNERKFLQWYGRDAYTGEGEVVDLGSWMGATVVPMACGLLDNPRAATRDKQVHAYDLFVWEDWMAPAVVDTPLEGKYQPGDSFVEEFHQATGAWSERVRTYAGDLTTTDWQGGPIEFLFVDAMKTWELANAILRHFFPSLIAGKSWIVHQDFVHYYTPWIHLVMYRLRSHFRPLHHIPRTSSVVFAVTDDIPANELGPYSFDDFTADETAAAFDYSRSIVPRTAWPGIKAAEIMLDIHRSNLDSAANQLAATRRSSLRFDENLEMAAKHLAESRS